MTYDAVLEKQKARWDLAGGTLQVDICLWWSLLDLQQHTQVCSALEHPQCDIPPT